MAVNRSMGEAVAQAGKLSATPLEGVQACVFDAYGTLFDYASAAARCRDALGDKLGSLTQLWREKQLQYTFRRVCHPNMVPNSDNIEYAANPVSMRIFDTFTP